MEKLEQQMGDRWFLSTTLALLAEAVYAQERYAEAGRTIDLTERSSAGDDVVSHILWRATRGKVLALGRASSTSARASSVRRWQSRETDDLNIQADKLIDLAEVLRLAGREDELDPLLVQALELYE